MHVHCYFTHTNQLGTLHRVPNGRRHWQLITVVSANAYLGPVRGQSSRQDTLWLWGLALNYSLLPAFRFESHFWQLTHAFVDRTDDRVRNRVVQIPGPLFIVRIWRNLILSMYELRTISGRKYQLIWHDWQLHRLPDPELDLLQKQPQDSLQHHRFPAYQLIRVCWHCQ